MDKTITKSVKVMVVDDHPEVLKTLTKILVRRGYEVCSFSNPVLALEEFQKNKPDIILSDLMMPQMNGIEFLAQVKNISPSTPFIIMTAFATVETALQATKYGAIDYIVKPFEISKLYDLLNKALRPQTAQISPL